MARRSTLLCLIPFAALIATAFMPGGVVIEGAVAENPGVGDQTTFQVSIQKGGLDYFGRILIQAPSDCQLTPSSLFGGSFDWDDDTHIAVVSWLKLPEPDRFDIEFNLLVDPNAVAGPRELDLEFSFIQNNDRATVTPPPVAFEYRIVLGPTPAPHRLRWRQPLARSAGHTIHHRQGRERGGPHCAAERPGGWIREIGGTDFLGL